MIRTRQEREAFERERLAPYAQKSGDSAGREHPEPKHPFRTEYERDRQRVIHSKAFRRLEYKTQVFLNGTGDHLRTRLTHTIEVASISRTIARGAGAQRGSGGGNRAGARSRSLAFRALRRGDAQ